jgi:hypothetical protein
MGVWTMFRMIGTNTELYKEVELKDVCNYAIL